MVTHAAGVAFVSVMGCAVQGVACDGAIQAGCQRWIEQAHAAGLLALVSGSPEPADLEWLWAAGLDGADAPGRPGS